ncbi:MAG TPA: ATP-dependent DNA ligase [Candidatus Acidoferrum sp.]|jgi:ATP-dependent DNA ligase|nr:ATP-dependent DNA ligase [Candidatus Acidoferrum sp.]
MTLPIRPPYEPMELQQAETIPDGSQWQYEPKWDGFRCLAFRDGEEVYLQSKAGEPLARYFPEVVEHLRALRADRFVLDGELMVQLGDSLSFDALLQRIHPAASRVQRLAKETPARYIIFDILIDADGTDVTTTPLAQRRSALEAFDEHYLRGDEIVLSPATTERAQVDEWFARVGNALDGVVAKRRDRDYASGSRDAGVKIKHLRTADCVVGGYRLNKERNGIGSLLLGLYDEAGKLNHIGFTSGFRANERGPLLKRLQPLEKPPGFTGSKPGGPSRWKQTEEPWFPLEPKLVVEVRYDHVTGDRFRHGTKILRWRTDKKPRQCTMDQLATAEAASPLELLS